MALYHVTGEILYPSGCECGAWKRQPIDRLVRAGNGTEASGTVLTNLPSRSEWMRDPVCRWISQQELEEIELARWNAGSPTSSPFALATARGER